MFRTVWFLSCISEDSRQMQMQNSFAKSPQTVGFKYDILEVSVHRNCRNTFSVFFFLALTVLVFSVDICFLSVTILIKQNTQQPNLITPKHPNRCLFLLFLFFNSHQWYSIGNSFWCLLGVLFPFALYIIQKMIKFSELCICTKQIICGYLGFELFIFLSLSFPCCCFLIRVVLFRCFIGFLVNPFDIKSRVPLHTLPLFSLFLSEGGLFSSRPMLLQITKLAEKFPLGILDPAQNLQQPLCQHQLQKVDWIRPNSSGVLKVVYLFSFEETVQVCTRRSN